VKTGVQQTHAIDQIAVARGQPDLFATGEFERRVRLWSFRQRSRIAELSTVLDSGGSRLLPVWAGRPIVIAGSYTKGVEAYEAKTGRVLWSRRDLKGVQQICELSKSGSILVGVGCEDRPYEVITAETGKSVSTIAGVKELYASPFQPLYLATGKDLVYLSSLLATTVWKRRLVSFAVLDAAFSPEQVAYSEAGGSLYCLDFVGNVAWSFHPEADHHVLRLVWRSEPANWLAIEWNYERGGSKRLLAINVKGETRLLSELRDYAELAFFRHGSHLITSDGEVISTTSGELVWKFA
jgi:outer membrane protein assembly factor BamB